MFIPLLLFGVASVITGVAGFGIGLLTMGFMPLFMGFRMANVTISFVSLGMVVLVIWPIRQRVLLRDMLKLLTGMMLGIPLGVLLLARVDVRLMKRLLGALILAYLVYETVLKGRIRLRLHENVGFLFGFIGGAFGGAFSSGAPPAVAYISSQGWDKEAAKANISLYLLVLGVYKLPFLFANRLVSSHEVPGILLFAVPGILGTLGGMAVFKRMSVDAFRVLVYVLLLISAGVLIVANPTPGA